MQSRNSGAGMQATVAPVTATMPAERGFPSMAASSPKNSPAGMSRRITSRPEIARIFTRTRPAATKKTSVPSSSKSMIHCPASTRRQTQRSSSARRSEGERERNSAAPASDSVRRLMNW